MVYTIVQLFCGFLAFVSIGQTCDKKTTKLEKVLGYIFCLVFVALILYIQEVLR